MLNLQFGITFDELYSLQGLASVDAAWLKFLESASSELYHALNIARSEGVADKAESDLIIALAPYAEDFIAKLFNIESEVASTANLYHSFAAVYKCKRNFVQRTAVKSYKPEDDACIDDVAQKLKALGVDVLDELSFANFVESTQDSDKLDLARIYAGWACVSEAGKELHKSNILFKLPRKLDFANLVTSATKNDGAWKSNHIHKREGFSLTDKGITSLGAFDQANYCIHCHNQMKDSCSHGMKDAEGGFKVNELKVNLAGCPLEEKISEMNLLKTQGSVIGSFAVAVIDNPMLAATGHRICNDCMKSCIYQKQDAVNIPMIETKVLDDVLDLPWGFEVYSLLTKWNPLNFKRTLPKDANGYKVLVAGLGPAGFTASHHLLNMGYTVVAIDGLKIEPSNPLISGVNIDGSRIAFNPIKDVRTELFVDLNDRVPQGFGGVAEYGITVRWNKNYLGVIRTLLERRANFRMYGGVRFGGTIDYNEAAKLGFDHIALALGAGRPNLLDIPNILAKGCRMASDFLMSLQLTGAAREESLANLQIRLPVVVIGGGLTAVDTATESLAYYPVQVEKFMRQYEIVGESLLASLAPEELEIANEFIEHAKLFRANPEQKLDIINKLGGVKVAYRKTLADAPAYRLNHEEVALALEEGIEFVENITPKAVKVDEKGSCTALEHEFGSIPARTILIATGTQPNVTLNSEDPENFKLTGAYFAAVNENSEVINPERISKPKSVDIIMDHGDNGPSVSFLGDLHPSFVGNVVKAMASAKQGVPIIDSVVSRQSKASSMSADSFFKSLDDKLLATVVSVEALTHNIQEVIVRAPLAAQKFEPGQFYRVQNYHNTIGSLDISMEGLALTGAWVDKEKGLVSLIVLEMGGSSNFCKLLKPGEHIVIMGPTGTPTHIPQNDAVMLVGGGLGNAVLFSIGKAMRANGCKVVYFAGYKKAADRFKTKDIEAAADTVVWCCDEVELSKDRASDYSFKGNILECIKAYGDISATDIKINDVNHIIAIGSDKMMAAVAYARHNNLKYLFKEGHIAIGSINSPMQCMMKEICGQCIQRHVDPKTGEESYVYSCFNQDQDLDCVDFEHLDLRLKQNSLQEKASAALINKLCREVLDVAS